MRRLAGNDPEVNEEWISDKDRFAFHYAQRGDRLTYPQVRDEDGALRPASWPEAFAVAARGLRRGAAGRPAASAVLHRRPAHRRGRLRLRQVRPRRRWHQRHRLPGPAALGRGGRLPGRRGRAGAARRRRCTYADLERAADRRARRPRARGRGRHDLPAAAQGRARTAAPGSLSLAPLATRGLAKCDGTLCPTVPGEEAGGARSARSSTAEYGTRRRRAVILVGERLADRARRADRGGRPGRTHRAPGWPGCRAAPATGARSRPAACPTCCPAAARSPTPPPGSTPPPPGASTHLPEPTRPRRRRDRRRRVARVSSAAWSSAGSSPTTPPTRPRSRAALEAGRRSWSAWSCARPR